jgi:hypothetical protein
MLNVDARHFRRTFMLVVSALRCSRSTRTSGGVVMGYREFIDSLGMTWKVWNTVPLAGAVLTGELKDGWLTFESLTSCLRRLGPVPANWEALTPDDLERLCAQAAEIRRATPVGGTRIDVPTSLGNALPEGNPNH